MREKNTAVKSETTAPKAKRRRRTSEDAKRVILDAAERRLRELGPNGIKLQEIARDVGVSHPAILHHFGSRDGLMQAVVRRALSSLRAAVLDQVRQQMHGEVDLPAILDAVFGIVAERGHARLIAWLILEGTGLRDETRYLRGLAEAGHVRMVEGGWTEGRDFDFDDMLFTVMLVGMTALGAGVAGDMLRYSSGLEDDADAEARFRRWFSRRLTQYLAGSQKPAASAAASPGS